MKGQFRVRVFAFISILSLVFGTPGIRAQGLLAAPANAPQAAVDCDNLRGEINEIVTENCLPGNPPSEWDVSGAGDSNIQGYATDISVDQGGTVHFKVDTDASDYRLDIYRLGYY